MENVETFGGHYDGGEPEKDEGQTQTPDTPPQDGSDGKPDAAGKTINISGKSFVVSDEIAQAYAGHTQDIDRRFDERSQELGGLRQFKNETLRREQELKDAANKQEQPNLATLMYEDPDKFVGLIKKEIKNEANNLRAEYQQAETTKKDEAVFWNSIWSENKDLEVAKTQAKDVIKMIGQKYAHLNLQNTRQVRDALAREAREWMKGIMGNSINNSQDGFVEGSSTTTSVKTKKAEDKPRRSTKEIIESRKEKKRKAVADRT